MVFHLPGLELADPAMQVAGVWLQRILWTDWATLEHRGDALRLHGEFIKAGHVFCCVNLSEKNLKGRSAEEVECVCQNALLILIAALRVHKTGQVTDPRFSNRYLRVEEVNTRRVGPYGARLLGSPPEPRYHVDTRDLAEIAFLHQHLQTLFLARDPGVMLALRSFGFSYGYGLSGAEKLAFCFSALEATYGEYRKQNRPNPRVTLGAAAAVVSREADPAALITFLDNAGRDLRNQVAHGDVSVAHETGDTVILRLEGIVRDGLRVLIVFTSEQSRLATQLEAIEAGLGSVAPKLAFQKLLGHAAKGSARALSVVASLLESFPPSL